MPARRETYRHGDLRRAIVRASAELLEAGGLEMLSIREVARRVGVTHAAPYHHFPDRAALLRAVAEEGFAALSRTMAREQDGAVDAAGRLSRCGTGYVLFAVESPGLFRLMFRPELTGIAASSDSPAVEEAWRILEDAVRDCQETGVAPPVPTRLLSTLCWSAVHGLASLAIDGPLRSARGGRAASVGELASSVTGLLSELLLAACPAPSQPSPTGRRRETGSRKRP